jgi:hypothetical protein
MQLGMSTASDVKPPFLIILGCTCVGAAAGAYFDLVSVGCAVGAAAAWAPCVYRTTKKTRIKRS